MKLKNKIILAASGLLVISGAAATTGTFAWYTANRTASLNMTTVGSKNNSTGFTLAVDTADTTATMVEDDTDDTAGTGDDKSVLTVAPGIVDTETEGAPNYSEYYLTEASSDGDGSFYKPMFNADGTTQVGSWTSSDFSAKYGKVLYYHRVSYKVTFSGLATNTMALYLNPSSKVTCSGSNLKPENIRMAIRANTTSSATNATAPLHTLYINLDGNTVSYLDSTGAAKTALPTEKYTKLDSDSTVNTLGTVTKSTYNTCDGYILESKAASTDAIYMTLDIWIEGTSTSLAANSTYWSGESFTSILNFYSMDVTNILTSI